MALLVPNVAEVVVLTDILAETFILKLYSNNKVPAEGDTAASYTEVAGGGYASKSLPLTWTITSGDPSFALYPATQNFNFTGVTNAPGTIYGYFIVNAAGVLMWAERFTESILPFVPINASLIRIVPRLDCS